MISLATSSIKSLLHQVQVVALSSTPTDWVQLPEYSLEQVSWHTKNNDCWIVIEDKVYDITAFIQHVNMNPLSWLCYCLAYILLIDLHIQHPGGYEIMMEQAGGDATLAFRGVGHSSTAENDLEKYLIGILPPRERIYISKSWLLSAVILIKKFKKKDTFSRFKRKESNHLRPLLIWLPFIVVLDEFRNEINCISNVLWPSVIQKQHIRNLIWKLSIMYCHRGVEFITSRVPSFN